MNKVMAKLLREQTPRVNRDITHGTAEEILRTFPEFLDNIFKNAIRRLNPNVKLEYHGYRKLSPYDDYVKNYRDKKNAIYDIASSDIYPIELRFTYMGKNMNRLLYLPFANKGNVISVSETKYHIVPVLSDNVISPTSNGVFIRLLIDKLMFKSNQKNFVLNGVKIPGNVIHSEILRTSNLKLKDQIGKPLVATAIYLCVKYGLYGTLLKYAKLKMDDIIVTNKDTSDIVEEFNIYESAKIKPRGLLVTGYRGHDIKICIRKKAINNNNSYFINNFIFGIIYTIDLQPEYETDMLKSIKTKDE